MIVRKTQLTSDFRNWWETDLSKVISGLTKERVITIIVEEGGVYLIYWAEEENK